MATAEPSEGDRYDAFVSYRRTDAAFARALEKALNSYQPPKGLAVPQRRLKVFRDEGDLTGTDYFKAIDQYLHRSSKLIVICSPAARASNYVDDEIRRFVGHQGAEHIIALLIAGVPNNEAGPDQAEQRAFPQALCDAVQMPLAVNYKGFDPAREKVNRGAFEGSWYTLLANLYGTSRDEVEQRDRVRRRRERNLVGAIVVSVIAGLATLAAVAWSQKLAADEQRNVALRGLSKYLATASDEALSDKPQTGLLLAIEAVRTTRDVDGTVTPAAQAALRQALSSASGHALVGSVEASSFSARGNRLATVGADGQARVWDLQALDQPAKAITLPAGKASIAGFTDDGQWLALATGGPSGLLLWNVDAPVPSLTRVAAGTAGGRGVSFSPDGRWLARAGDDARLRLWRLGDLGAEPLVLAGHTVTRDYKGKPQGVIQVAFDPQAQWLFSTAWDKSAKMWNLRDPQAPAQVLANASLWAVPHFSPDGQWFAQLVDDKATKDSLSVGLWRLKDGQWQTTPLGDAAAADGSTHKLPPETQGNPVVGFHPTLPRLVTALRGEVRVWALDAAPATFRAMSGYAASLSADGTRLATVEMLGEGGKGGHIVRVHSLSAPDTAPVQVAAFDAPVVQLLFSPPGRHLAIVTADGRLWRVAVDDDEPAPQRLRGFDFQADQAHFSADGRWLLATAKWGEFGIRAWRIDNASSDPAQVDGASSRAELSYKSRNGGGGGEPVGGLPNALAVDRTSRWLLVPGERHTAMLVDLNDPAASPRVLAGHGHDVTAVAFDPQDQWVATADWNHSVRIWKMSALDRPSAVLALPEGEQTSSVSAMAVSPDGTLIATGGNTGQVALWNLGAPGAAPRLLEGHKGWITSLSFSADGKQLLSASEGGKALVWNVAGIAVGNVAGKVDPTPSDPVVLDAHRDAVVGALYAAGGSRIVTAGSDALVQVWATTDLRRPSATLRGHADRIASVSLEPGGRWLLTGSLDGTVRVWDLQAAEPPSLLLGPRKAPINVVSISADSRLVAAADSTGDIRVWSRTDPEAEPAVLRVPRLDGDRGRRAAVWSLRFSPDGRWLTALAAGKVHLWRLRIDEQLALACDLAGRNMRLAEWQPHLESVPYRLSCKGKGLHRDWLADIDKLAKLGEVERATALYQASRALDPTLTLEPHARAVELASASHLEYGRNLARQGQLDAATAELSEIRRIDPKNTLDAAAEVQGIVKAQALLKSAAEKARRGSLEPAIELYKQARAIDASLDIEPESTAKRLMAPSIEEHGDTLAREGRLDEAATEYERALAFGLESDLVPQVRARNVRAWALVKRAGDIGREGDLENATQTFREALALEPALTLDPVKEGRKSVIEHRLAQADRLAHDRKIAEAVAIYRQVREWDEKASLSASNLNELCWQGAIQNMGSQVLDFCDLAVAGRPDDGAFRDSRGVARVLANDVAGGIADFEAFIAWAAKTGGFSAEAEARKRWVEQLRRGARVGTYQQLEALGAKP